MTHGNKIIILSLICSLLMGMFNVEIVFNDNIVMIQILLSVLALSLTAYTFVLVPIQNILNGNDNERLVSNLLKEYMDDMKAIFFSVIFLIIIDVIYKFDFPSIINPSNIDFGLFKIHSLKYCFKLIIEDFLCFLSLYSFYDIMNSIFILVESSLLGKK